MAGNTHRENCANAQNPGCVCTGCGGSLHGWQGWTGLAFDPQRARDEKRRKLERKVERTRRGDLSFNARNRQAYIDLARLDIADSMSAPGLQRASRGAPLPKIDVADAGEIRYDAERVTFLGQEIMEKTWKEISVEIDGLAQSEHRSRDIKKQLADHAWCGLLVALIRWIEKLDEAAKFLSEQGKNFVKIHLATPLTGLSKTLADAVIDIVVDKVWTALSRLIQAHFPVVGDDTLRVLRILALFACPSIEQHPDVYKYAARPLMGDAQKLISEDVRETTIALFTSWWTRRAPEAA
ncbi:hypothetical protein Ade02nite_67100 [Paractinoplanes deccanensis]|uniref:Uncharacterized protein n=1 Tax=Paractinoplanes deccanensis TaxID=113561 RepID=A0ABQ3YDI8_9ACTN|nr:hypothetical protein [Actinoplanes deccanensis]GID78069.1 hypothetical protein Ade02nite_67100 [Actinoplanes deccanensis]